ncbi:hypothetical protein PUN28_007430 [Cardiocondyla obscurior]|uniref:Uncharacterized protein n=1 Tax=Cardiocondyla obscurior TaxID=286306 RepID=A0AAW2G3W5_9HYME
MIPGQRLPQVREYSETVGGKKVRDGGARGRRRERGSPFDRACVSTKWNGNVGIDKRFENESPIMREKFLLHSKNQSLLSRIAVWRRCNKWRGGASARSGGEASCAKQGVETGALSLACMQLTTHGIMYSTSPSSLPSGWVSRQDGKGEVHLTLATVLRIQAPLPSIIPIASRRVFQNRRINLHRQTLDLMAKILMPKYRRWPRHRKTFVLFKWRRAEEVEEETRNTSERGCERL